MITAIPLTILPLILFNIVGFAGGGADWSAEIFGIVMISGARWSLTLGDLMITFGIVILFLEVMKSGRTSTASVTNHILSTVVLIIYVIELVLVAFCANSVFFILTLIALFDVVAGFTITIRTASRDVNFGHGFDGGP
ncbi:MAG: hypothetical protein KDJ86_10385 [Bauldia sp.]|uniref:hypothetical protein n=1 Tax=Bauldia sp. TaxID=2575872 RepID=UPI001DE29248|nr:hypothetical protein [Bauldia sp.]MCB1496183.1 hypothetical protein [Bauldia sp.]